MKILKVIGILIAALVAIFLIVAAAAPKEYTVKRTITVNADLDAMFQEGASVKSMDENWSPWREKDPDVVLTYEGEDGTVGSLSRWNGDDMIGEGTRTISAIELNKRIETEIAFIRPWEDTGFGFMDFEETDEGVNVTWGFNGKSPFPMSAMMLFIDMDAQLGADFQKGLEKFKAHCESLPQESESTFDIVSVDLEARNYLTIKGLVKFEEMPAFFDENIAKLFELAMAAGVQPLGPPSGLYFSWDEENAQTEMAVGIPVEEGAEVEGLEAYAMNAGKALMIDYVGPYEESQEPHLEMGKYIEENGMVPNGIVFEDYMNSPETEPDPNKMNTRIYYFVE